MKQAALSFILTLFPIMASADGNGTFGENLTWSYVEATSTLTISGTGAMTNYSIVYYGASIYIGTPWRYNVSSIKKIIIESGVTSIGNCVFYNCSSLTSVTIPNSVTRIGDNSFYGCSSLTSVTIPNSVTSIGNNAFQYCRGLTSVTIPNSVTSIGNNAFQYCLGLTSVTISNSVTSIGNNAFSGCSDLTTVTIPNSVISIGESAFSGCSGLTSVTIPNSVTSIGNNAFGKCSGLETIVSEIKTPFEIGSIGDTSITLIVPAGTKADYQSTAGWSSFTNMVEVGEGGVAGSKFEINGIRYTIDENSTASLISANGVISGALVIPSQVEFNGKKYDVTSIGREAFQEYRGLTSVTIPNSVTNIGDNSFYGCSGLTSVTIPNSVTSIGNNAFGKCSGLETIVSEIKTPFVIGSICDTSITLMVPAGTKADYQSTAGWSSFTNMVEVGEGGVAGSKFEINGIRYTIDENNTASLIYANKAISGALVIPSQVEFNGKKYDVTSIGREAFQECSGLTSVTIPNSVTSIGDYAFAYCGGLTSVTIPNSVTSIGESAFFRCIGLTSVTIPNSVTSIGKSAFNSCSGLTSVTISNSVTSIGGRAFEYCNSLTSVKVPVTDFSTFCNNKAINLIRTAIGKPVQLIDNEGTEITEFIMPNDVTSISESAFENCSGLTSVTISNSVTSIGGRAFSGCSSLNSVIIPNSVTSIGESAFENCIGLTSVTISNSVTSIGGRAFEYCNSLTSVKVPVTDYSAFCNNKVINLIRTATGKLIQLIDKEGIEITEYIVPNDVTTIGESAFIGCSDLTSVTIGNSVSSIGNSAFYGCSGLTSVIIGSGVLSVGSNAFSNTNLKKTIWLTNTPPSGYSNASGTVNYVSNDQFGISNQIVYKYLSSHFVVDGIRYVPVSPSDRTCDAIDCTYDASIESINIGETVTNKGVTLTVMKVNPYTCYYNKHIKDVKLSSGGDIGDYAFYECTNLVTATVSNKGSIGASAFQASPALESAYISNIGDIGAYAFQSCPALKTATISNQGNIGKNAFESCSAMTTVNITSLGDIGEYAFQSCSALTSATINNQGGIGGAAFSGCSLLEATELGQNVTSIGNYAFDGCSKLKSIVIPDAVNALGSYAFQNCAVMTSAKIGNGIETIDEYTFSGCSSLNEINIGSKVKTINRYAFSGCGALPSITIPQAVTNIGNNVFSECTSLAKVTIADSETTLTLGSNGSSPIFSSCPLDYVYIGRDISYKTSSSYGYSPFYRNTTLREVIITDKETEISENQFYGCTNLQTVTIDDGVTTIGNWAFSGCQSLKFFTFGSKVKTIGQEAFSDCTAVTEISSRAITPPICGNQALDDINKWECKLYVPKGHLADYQAAEQWKEFFFAEERDYGILFESITIGKSGKASYCGDKSLVFSFSDEVKAYIATGFDKDEGIIWLTRVKDVPAGVPVLIKGEANKTFDVPVTDSQNSYYTNMFVGNTSGETVQITETDGVFVNYYLSGDGTFKSVNKSANIGNNKCYLQLPGTFKPAVAGATQKVTIKDIGKASYAAPVDLDFTNVEGLKAFSATGYDKSSKTIWLTRVMKVQKGEGLLLKGDAKDYEIPSAAVQSSYMNMFVGNTSGDKIQVQEKSEDGSQTNFYLNGEGSFVSVNGFVNIGNNKCYMELPTSMVTTAASTRGAEVNYILEEPEVIKLPISFRSIGNDGDGTTEIKDQSSKSNVPSDAYYTLQGQRVAKPGMGLYIKNGKKVVIK